MIVLDASAAMEIVRQTEAGKVLLSFLTQDEKIHSCNLMYAEVASVSRKLKRTEGLTFEEAQACMINAVSLVNEFHPIEDFLEEAFAESVRLDHSVYDMFYFVLARRTGGTLFSVDRPLLELCAAHGVNSLAIYDLDEGTEA